MGLEGTLGASSGLLLMVAAAAMAGGDFTLVGDYQDKETHNWSLHIDQGQVLSNSTMVVVARPWCHYSYPSLHPPMQ